MSPLAEIRASTPDEVKDIDWTSTRKERGRYHMRSTEEVEFGRDLLSRLNESETGRITLVFTATESEEPHVLDSLMYASRPCTHARGAGRYIKRLFKSLNYSEIQYRTMRVDKEDIQGDWKLIISFIEKE